MLNFCPLYRPQNLQLFHGQFLVILSIKLLASLGGRIGPSSNPSYSSQVFICFLPFHPARPHKAQRLCTYHVKQPELVTFPSSSLTETSMTMRARPFFSKFCINLVTAFWDTSGNAEMLLWAGLLNLKRESLNTGRTLPTSSGKSCCM